MQHITIITLRLAAFCLCPVCATAAPDGKDTVTAVVLAPPENSRNDSLALALRTNAHRLVPAYVWLRLPEPVPPLPPPLPPAYMLGDCWVWGECLVSCDSLEWSGELRNPAGCTRREGVEEMTTGNIFLPQFRDWDGYSGYFYNWACVDLYAWSLCPSPWRIPTRKDVEALLKCTTCSALQAAWDITGYDSYGWLALHDEWSLNWTSEPKDKTNAWGFGYDAGTGYLGWWWGERTKGLQVRCVRTINK